jgi:uncharacterized protein (TIRG00374 family)
LETSSNLQPASLADRLKLIGKFAVVILVFWYLNHKGLLTAEMFSNLARYPAIIAICSFLIILNTVLGSLRWHVLLKTQGTELSFYRVLKLNLVGCFFNIALPGAVSGDFFKAFYAAKYFPEKRAAVVGSIVFDRVLGLSALVFVAALSALVSSFIPWGGALPHSLLYSIEFCGFIFASFFVYLFLSHERDPLFSFLKFFTKRSQKLVPIERLYEGVMSYRSHPKRVLKAIALSVAIHVMLILLVFFLSEALSPQSLPLMGLAVIVPIGMLATSIPVLPAGVGTGHAAFYALFKLIGSDQGAQVFSLYVIFQLLVGMIGGLVYLRVSHEKTEPAAKFNQSLS